MVAVYQGTVFGTLTEKRTLFPSQPLQSPFVTGNRENLGIISDKLNVVEIWSSGNYTNGEPNCIKLVIIVASYTVWAEAFEYHCAI
jgi:hypothetical protein